MKRILTVILALASLATPVRAEESGLVAELVGGDRDDDGRLILTVPFDGAVDLGLRLENRGEAPVQVVLSSWPFYRFAKLEVARIGPDGERTGVPAHFDLYPLKDMKAPARVFTTLAPGESVVRSLDVLIREGYGLTTFADSILADHFTELRTAGFGKFLVPGEYELTGIWSPDPTSFDGTPIDVFEGERGRDSFVPIAGSVRTEPLRAVTRFRHDFDALSRRIAAARHVVVGDCEWVPDRSVTGSAGGYATFAVTVTRTITGPEVPSLRFRKYIHGPNPVDPRELAGPRLLFLLEAEGELYPVDDDSIAEPNEPAIEAARSRVSFQDWLLRQPARPDAETARAVGALVEKLVESPEAQREALLALEAMGDRAVRALVTHLGDHRSPAEKSISFRNHARDAFEGIRHYRAENVGEAIACLLNQITGESFPSPNGFRILAHYAR